MPLMDRIKVTPYHTLHHADRLDQITTLQALRLNIQEEERLKQSKAPTKSAKRNLAKRGKKVKDPKAEALKLLKKMSPKQIEEIRRLYS